MTFCYACYNRGTTLKAFIIEYNAIFHHFRTYCINTAKFSILFVHCRPRSHIESRLPHWYPKNTQCSKIVSYSRIPFGQRNSLRWQDIPIACTGVSQRATNKVSSYNSAHELNMCGQYYWQACDHPIVTRT